MLAHPDDEVLFWPLIARVPAGELALAYMTDGSAGGRFHPQVRADETRRVLSAFGVDPASATFLGQQHALADGVLHQSIGQAWSSLWSWAATLGDVSTVYTHAWEGGHQDHDVCHALALAFAEKTGAGKLGQVACYRRPDRGPAPFSLLDPIAANGPVEGLAMTGAEKRAMTSCLLRYPSQWRSWVGLGPPLLTKIALDPKLPVQQVSRGRLNQRPHTGKLLYEQRGGPTYDDIGLAVGDFLAGRSS